jgi:sterol desaturase/sphingolipid hydroxylase (fatty acid hydroxylase superfamily)
MSKPRSYNVKFNKPLFRRHVIAGLRQWLVGSAAMAVPAGLTLYAFLVWQWPTWPVAVSWMVFLYWFVGGLWTTASDYCEYRRIHERRESN